MQAAFKPIKRKQQVKMICKTVLFKQEGSMCSKVFEAILSHAIKEQTLRDRLAECTQRKNGKLKAKVFKVLVCPEFYMSKEPL